MITYEDYIDEIKNVSGLNLSWELLDGQSILIAGATGLIGSCLVDVLGYRNKKELSSSCIYVMSRSLESIKKRFPSFCEERWFIPVVQDIVQPFTIECNIDYIINAASNSEPASFSRFPVETLMTNVVGTHQLLNYGLKHGMKRFLYVSSGEIYGQPNERMDNFVEDYCGPIDYSSPRACYPAGKRASEVLCQSFIEQYQADTVIVRPCHIFGPTMRRNDSHAVSEFLWNAVDGKDIIMKSDGLIERSHCFVVDAVEAILLVLFRGKKGEAYNIADPSYQMTIRKFAETAAQAGHCCIRYEKPNDAEAAWYSPIRRVVLSSTKLQKLGWNPSHEDVSAISKTVHILKKADIRRGKP